MGFLPFGVVLVVSERLVFSLLEKFLVERRSIGGVPLHVDVGAVVFFEKQPARDRAGVGRVLVVNGDSLIVSVDMDRVRSLGGGSPLWATRFWASEYSRHEGEPASWHVVVGDDASVFSVGGEVDDPCTPTVCEGVTFKCGHSLEPRVDELRVVDGAGRSTTVAEAVSKSGVFKNDVAPLRVRGFLSDAWREYPRKSATDNEEMENDCE